MLKAILRSRIVIVLCLVLVLCSQEAFAWGGGHGGDHYYRGGRWYRHGWMGLDIAVSALAIGALVESLPPRCATVVVGGVPYYYYDNYYYRPYPGGYVVVPPPVMTQPIMVAPQAAYPAIIAAPESVAQGQPQAQSPENVTINIPNSRGGYTAVTLRRSGSGFVGPQGEYYPENPTVEQLKVLYGK